MQFTNLFSLVLHLVWLHLFTSVLEFDYLGVAFAMLLTSVVNFSSVAAYLWFKEGHHPFKFSWDRVMKAKYVKVYLVLAAPSIALVCAQWWAVELL